MTRLVAVAVLALLSMVMQAAPLPPAIEKLNKEGLAAAAEVTIQGSLNDTEPEGTHLVKLQKGQVYAIDLGGPGLKLSVRIEDPDGQVVPMDPSLTTLRPARDGSYRFRVAARTGGTGKYLLGVRQLPPAPDLPPGVHTVAPGGLSIASTLDMTDNVDRLRKQPCKIFDVKMLAGKSYSIDMTSQRIDSYLRLEDATGKNLAEDDDSGGNLNARIIFRPGHDGVYRVISTTFGAAWASSRSR